MKKRLLLLSSLILSGLTFSQIYSDDFESYAAGSYICVQNPTYWATWTAGQQGTTQDVMVNATQASSGANSLYLQSSGANGGPQDIILKFGQLYNSGIFTLESDIYVNSGKNAYFNLQGSQTIGQIWALNVNMDGGTITIDDGLTSNLATGTYTPATWFTFKIEANLTLQIWKAFVDGVEIGQWQNGINAVASWNLYPILNSQYYVDDVSFDHQTYTLQTLNAMASSISMGGSIAGQTVNPTVVVKNAGVNQINSFDITLNYNGMDYTQNITGLSLNSLQNYNVQFSGIELVAGLNLATATISNVNGGMDDDATDDEVQLNVNPVVPAAGKIVVGEEATGTWCVWCPRGAVFMDRFANDYDGYWAGIAVHGGQTSEPMRVPIYDSGIAPLISGHPSSLVDRGSAVDPSQMTAQFFQRLQTAPVAVITNGATWDATSRTLNVSVTADFQSGANSNYKIVCVLTEDGVTGTTSAYNQANAYAGGGNGVMGGYELLPNPVPASQMVYDHVARHIAPSFGGFTGSFPATVNAGEEHTVNFTFVLPASWNADNMHIVGMLVAPNGRIDNAGYTTIAGAVSNGYESGVSAGLSELTDEQLDDVLKVYPNPANEYAVISINLSQDAQVVMNLIDLSGKQIATRNYGAMIGLSEVVLNTQDLQSGVYIVELFVNGERVTKRLVVE
jgi:hypothetical protein